MKILLYFIGKPKNAHANGLAEEYTRRAERYASLEMREIRPDRFDPWEKHAAARKVALDPAGKPIHSAGFAALVAEAQMQGRDLLFLVGGHDGLPPGWAERADLRLALSALTMPHELARVVVAEQIYRALATLRGHPYPR